MSTYVSILEIAPYTLESETKLCVCEGCGKTFKPEDTLMENCDNISFGGILCVKGITKGKKTWYLVSPCCKKTHLFGFDMVEDERT